MSRRRDDHHHVETRDGFTAYLVQDTDCESPREHDNLTVMVGWHRRQWIGDYTRTGNHGGEHQWGHDDPETIRERIADLRKRQHVHGPEQVVFLSTLGCYEHSGTTVWLGGQFDGPPGTQCQWDSGVVGLVYITRARVLEIMGWKQLTKARLAKLAEYAEGEVKEYARWMEGDCYGVVIEAGDEDDDDAEQVDSCWGFIGSDYATEEAQRMLQEQIDAVERKRQQQIEEADNA